MKKKYLILLNIAVLFLSTFGLFEKRAFAIEADGYNIQTVIGKEFFWASKPGNNSEVFKIGQEVKIPLQYLDKSGKKEINFILYDKNGNPLNMTRYKLYLSKSGIIGASTTSNEYKKKGHAHFPILGAGTVSIYLEDYARVEASVKIATLTISDVTLEPLKSSSGLPLTYNTPYHIFNDSLKGKRGGLKYEPYSNVDRMLYDNSISGKGTAMMFQDTQDASSNKEIKWGDQLRVKSSSANWGNSTYWSVSKDYPNVSFITLSSSPSTFYISNGRNVSNSIDKNSFGLSSLSADMIMTGDFLFYLNSLNPTADYNNKEWLKASGKYHFATNWQGERDKLQNGLQASQQGNMRVYEADYKTNFIGLTTSSDSVTYTITKKYHHAKIRFVLKINGEYYSESYDGKSYYSGINENSTNGIEITTNLNLKKGDHITLDVLTNEPGYSIDKSTVLQTLDSKIY